MQNMSNATSGLMLTPRSEQAMYNNVGASAPAKTESVYKIERELTPQEIEKQQEIIKMIEADKLFDGWTKNQFNKWFIRVILNAPLDSNLTRQVKNMRQGKSDMIATIKPATYRGMLNSVFAWWQDTYTVITTGVKSGNDRKDGAIVIVQCHLDVEFPVTNTRKTFEGITDTRLLQNTAPEAAKSFAFKNAAVIIGDYFGLGIFADSFNEYDEAPTVSRTQSAIDNI